MRQQYNWELIGSIWYCYPALDTTLKLYYDSGWIAELRLENEDILLAYSEDVRSPDMPKRQSSIKSAKKQAQKMTKQYFRGAR
jgi:hypothetical protein